MAMQPDLCLCCSHIYREVSNFATWPNQLLQNKSPKISDTP